MVNILRVFLVPGESPAISNDKKIFSTLIRILVILGWTPEFFVCYKLFKTYVLILVLTVKYILTAFLPTIFFKTNINKTVHIRENKNKHI